MTWLYTEGVDDRYCGHEYGYEVASIMYELFVSRGCGGSHRKLLMGGLANGIFRKARTSGVAVPGLS